MLRSARATVTVALGLVLLVGPPSAVAVNAGCPAGDGAPCSDAGKTGVRCQTESGEKEFSGIDEYCLSCHGHAAPRRLCSGVRPIPHSSAIPYPVRTHDLRPLSTLDPRLKLRGGRVTCETCHGGRDAAASYLSIPLASSALCRACHLK